jgi:SAM-dependent methyltransferase
VQGTERGDEPFDGDRRGVQGRATAKVKSDSLMAMVSQAAEVTLPDAFDFTTYRLFNPDLAGFSAEELVVHYRRHGEAEGRRTNALDSRSDFAALIPEAADSLEIGPFYNPLLRGKRTKYFDVLPRRELAARARSLNFPDVDVPEIDYVSVTGDLGVVGETFDCVLSSHCIEHQPDLVRHLRDVGRLLRPSGRYFVLAPDKRYCFDHFIAESNLADVLEAHVERRARHALKSVIEHRVLTTHNDSSRHWANDHGLYLNDYELRTKAALEEFERSEGSYIDVHAWYLTPTDVKQIVPALRELGYIDLGLERLYPTRYGMNEFWFVLRKG